VSGNYGTENTADRPRKRYLNGLKLFMDRAI
jgi:hypothetical protein